MAAGLNAGIAVSGPAARRELWQWSALAVLSLAVAGLFAFLLALSRVPGIESWLPWPVAFFAKGLVVHVVFAFVLWFLAVFAALCQVTADALGGGRARLAFLGPLAVALCAGAFVLLLVPALLDRGEPTLNNYVPVIVDPLYYAGLAAMAAGIALAVVRLWLTAAGGLAWTRPPAVAVVGASVLFAAALACAALAWRDLAGRPVDHAFNEDLTWGAGHVLQFVNAALLIGAWQMLAQATVGRPALPARAFQAAVGMLVAAGAAAPAFYLIWPDFAADQRMAFTNLQYALAPPAALAGLGLAAALRLARRAGPLPWRDPGFLCLVLSPVTFAAGAVLGLFVDGADTRTPAHYHGVIAGIMLAFFGLYFRLILPRLGREPTASRGNRVAVWLFGIGQTAACLGLFWAGGYGAPRKAAGADQGLEGLGQTAGMAINGAGAAIAVVGGIMFIWVAGRALLKKAPGSHGRRV